MDLQVLGMLTKQVKAVASGYAGSSVDGDKLTINFVNGDSQTVTIRQPEDGTDGVSITDVAVNDLNELVVTLSDGQTIIAGVIETIQGVDGKDGKDGADGADGKDGVGIMSIERTAGTGSAGTTDTYTITLTDGRTSEFTVYNGADGVGGSGGTGETGADGVGIDSIERTSGDGSAGTTDIYSIVLTDGRTSEFTIYNGKDGAAGSAGSAGADGITPHIGANGNWYLGAEDTGVCASATKNSSITSVTLLASDWDTSNNTQTVTVPGVSGDELVQTVTVVPVPESTTIYRSCGIYCYDHALNTLRFVADTLPAEDIETHVMLDILREHDTTDYSIEETVVGTWIDGKPIYRRILTGTAVNGKTPVTNTGDIDLLLSSRGYICEASEYSLIPRLWSTTIHVHFIKPHDADDIYLYSQGYVGLEYTAVVEYTKTTDAACVSSEELNESYEEGVNLA